MLCCFIGVGLPVTGQQASSTNPLNDLLTMQMNWDASKSDDNARPSILLKFVPYEKHTQDGKTFTSYYVYAPGLPTDKPYTMIRWQIGWDASQPPFTPVQTNLYANDRGVVMCRKPSNSERNLEASAMDSDTRLDVIAAGSMGEPVRFALYTDGDGVVAMGRIIVNPIQADDKGCHLQAILAVGGGQIMLVEGTGFASNAKVSLSRTSGGQSDTAEFRTDKSGRLETVAILTNKGQAGGKATIVMRSDSCAPAVTFQWGADSYKVQ